MKKSVLRQFFWLLGGSVALCVGAVSQAAIITNGCADAQFCTLSELYGSGNIQINDVTFGNWSENINDGGLDQDDVRVYGVDEVVSGSDPLLSNLGLSFMFDPAFASDFLEYDFGFEIEITGLDRSFIGADLDLSSFNHVDDAFVEVNNDLLVGLLSVDQDNSTETSSFGGVEFLLSSFDIQMETFDSSGFISLSQFDFGLQVSGPPVASVDESSAFFLLLTGLVGFGWARRRAL